MAAATVTSKGQITLPKSVRDRLKLASGDRVEFYESGHGFLMKPAKHDIRALKGILPKLKRTVTIDEMNRTIEKMGR